MGMTAPPRSLPLVAALLAALTVGASRAEAASFLGSLDPSATPDSVACADCPAGVGVGVRQFALRQATVEAPEDGVLVSASANATRIAGTEDPRIAVLRPSDEDGVNLAVVASAPVPLSGDVSSADDLHLPMRRGDSIGFLFRTGEVALGVRARPRPDGAIQSFEDPCDPCGMDGGTGSELLFAAVLEPDVDGDTLGDETQDPDGGGLGLNWENDWFQDYDEGDQLDEDFGDSAALTGPGAPRRQAPAERPPAQRRRVAADQRPQCRAGERPGHAPGQPPHRRRPVHDDPDRRHARQARRAGPPAPGRDPRGRTRPREAQAGADEGGHRLPSAEVDPFAADALGPVLAGGARDSEDLDGRADATLRW